MKLNEKLKKLLTEKSGMLVLLGTVGLCIIVLSSIFDVGEEKEPVQAKRTLSESTEYCEKTEKKLTEFICKINGVSEADVIVTLGCDEQLIYAQEGKEILSDGKREEDKQYVMTGNSGEKTALIETVKAPEINGVVVAYRGNSSATVRESIYNTVSTALNIPMSCVYVTMLKER